MFKVENFLFCMTLETGGLVIGWLSLIASIIGSIFALIGFILLCIFGCDDLAESQDWNESDIDVCNTFRGVIIGVLIVLVAILIGFAIISVKCIKGTKNRNHFQVKPMMILLGVLTVLSITQLAKLSTGTIINAIIDIMINAYCFVVMYSLYTVFRQEYERGGSRLQPQYQVAGKV